MSVELASGPSRLGSASLQGRRCAYRGLAASVRLALAAGVLACAVWSTGFAQPWSELHPDQQRILEPLRDDWPNIEPARRKKWIEITKRYNRMSVEQQERLQTRMRQWAALSPEERKQVRERYKKLQDMPPERREEILRKWEEYDSLTEQEKDTLRQAHPNAPQRPTPNR